MKRKRSRIPMAPAKPFLAIPEPEGEDPNLGTHGRRVMARQKRERKQAERRKAQERRSR